jgi:ribonuclease P protein component
VLEKKNRLSKTKEIKQAFYTKYKTNTKFTKIFLRKKREPDFQLLVIVSSKISKRAVKRNRIKRRIIGLFERMENRDKKLAFFTCVIQVKNKDILIQKTSALREDILGSLEKLILESKSFKFGKNEFNQKKLSKLSSKTF